MRLLLTAVDARRPAEAAARVDVAVDCEDDASVADLARRLAEHLGVAVPEALTHQRAHLGVVGSTATVGAVTAPAPPLHLGAEALPPDQKVAVSALRHGVVVGVGGAVPDVLAEPDGTVEVRVASGPGAGVVHRLGVGEYALGSAAGSDLRLDDPGLPDRVATVVVGLDGEVVVRAEAAAAGRTLPAPGRRRPLSGPIVVSERVAPAPEKKRRFRRRRRRQVSDEQLSQVRTPHRTVDPADERALLEVDRTPRHRRGHAVDAGRRDDRRCRDARAHRRPSGRRLAVAEPRRRDAGLQPPAPAAARAAARPSSACRGCPPGRRRCRCRS